MLVRVIVGVAIGVCLGALMGHYGQCSSGTCPLTANPLRGAIYGGVMGALFAFSFAGTANSRRSTGVDGGNEHSSSAVIYVKSAADFESNVVNASMPCLADFYSDSCGPCRRLAPTIETLADSYTNSAVVCKVSLDSASELAHKYGIRSIPAVLFFKDGKEVKRIVGLRKQAVYEKILDTMVSENTNKKGE